MASTSTCFWSVLRDLETQEKLEPFQVEPDEKQETVAKDIHLMYKFIATGYKRQDSQQSECKDLSSSN